MIKMQMFSLLALVICAAGQLMAQSGAPVTLVKAGRLLDPRTGNVLMPAVVLVENGKIKEVGPPSQVQSHAPHGAKSLDLGSATLLPGLIDAHTHLFLDVVVPPTADSARRFNGDFVADLLLAIVESPSKRVLVGAQMAREDLDVGGPGGFNLSRKSPINSARSINIPILLVYSTAEGALLNSQSERMAKALEDIGKDVKVTKIRDVDGWMWHSETRVQVLTEIEAFLAKSLQGSSDTASAMRHAGGR